jgi:serine/threonine protein kinase
VRDAGVQPSRFGERFRVLARSGAGGMSTVYRATDLVTGQDIALKVLDERDGTPPERFNAEAALLAELAHPAIVRYVDHGVTAGGERYLAMEWLDGETLEARLTRGPLGIMETLRLAYRVLEGLAVAHRKGIVHRDIKPANLFLPGGDLAGVKLLDFGIASRSVDSRRPGGEGESPGTPAYMSPEQARGDQSLDARSDVFSLGCVLYECLTGAPPFAGESALAVMAKLFLHDSVAVETRRPDLPGPVAVLLTRMLAKEPAARPPTATMLGVEMAAAIVALAAQALGTGEPTAGEVVLPADRAPAAR